MSGRKPILPLQCSNNVQCMEWIGASMFTVCCTLSFMMLSSMLWHCQHFSGVLQHLSCLGQITSTTLVFVLLWSVVITFIHLCRCLSLLLGSWTSVFTHRTSSLEQFTTRHSLRPLLSCNFQTTGKDWTLQPSLPSLIRDHAPALRILHFVNDLTCVINRVIIIIIIIRVCSSRAMSGTKSAECGRPGVETAEVVFCETQNETDDS